MCPSGVVKSKYALVPAELCHGASVAISPCTASLSSQSHQLSRRIIRESNPRKVGLKGVGSWILRLCYPGGQPYACRHGMRGPQACRENFDGRAGAAVFRSHAFLRGETRGGTLAGWVLRHTVRTLLARFVTGETVVGSAQGCQGETPVNAEEMSMAIDALIGGGVQAAARRPWSCGSAHPARSTERLLITITPGVGAPPPSVLLGPILPLIICVHCSDLVPTILGVRLAFVRTCGSRGAEGTYHV